MKSPGYILLLLSAAVPTFAQDAGVVFHSGVSLIRVDAEVLDASGAIVEGLKAEDFIVSDEGRPQPIRNFSFEEEPLDLIFLFDLSGSMRGKLLGVVRAVELGFHELKKGDRACVMAFNSDAFEVAPFTPDLDVVNQSIVIRIPGLHFGGTSRLTDAARAAALRLRREPDTARRRAVLVVTDKASGAGAQPVVAELWRSNAVLSELVIGNSAEIQVSDRSPDSIAASTGGAIVVAGDPGLSFQRAVRLLRRRYTLYYPAPDGLAGAQRNIDVRLSSDALKRFPGARVRARTGYIVPTP